MRLPRLNALRAFEATVRAGSLNGAAAELFVTPTAVSRHIKKLEDYLGVTLFERGGGHLVPNEIGRRYALALNRSFRAIADSTAQVRSSSGKAPVVLRAYTTLLVHWLMPRLGLFQREHPEIELNIESGFRSADFSRGSLEIAIRYGNGTWPNLKSFRIFSDESVAFSAPSVAERLSGISPDKWPRDVSLLVHGRRPLDWTDWLSIAGIEDELPHRRLSFEDMLLVYQAAHDGLGVAIAQRRYIAAGIARRTLMQVSPVVLRRELGYYAVCPQEVADTKPARAFIEWLVKEGERQPDEFVGSDESSAQGVDPNWMMNVVARKVSGSLGSDH
ncbi:MAG: LysR substrate-binding domain-containing protein [Pseudorhodoplanes sp.]